MRSAFTLLEGSGDTPALARAHATVVWLFQRREERQQCVDAAQRGLPGGRARRGRGGHARDHDEPRRDRALPRGHGRLDPARRRVAARSAAGLGEAASMALNRMVAYRSGSKDPHAALPLAQDALDVAMNLGLESSERFLRLRRRGLPHRCRPSRRSGRGSEVARGADRSFRPVPLATARRARSCGDEARRAGGARRCSTTSPRGPGALTTGGSTPT